jgi:hypothetical protein
MVPAGLCNYRFGSIIGLRRNDGTAKCGWDILGIEKINRGGKKILQEPTERDTSDPKQKLDATAVNQNDAPQTKKDANNTHHRKHTWVEKLAIFIAGLALAASAWQAYVERDSEVRGDRAYVYVRLDGISYDVSTTGFGNINYSIFIANSGQTPAQNVSINYTPMVSTYPLVDAMWITGLFNLSNPTNMLFKDVTTSIKGSYPAIPGWQNLGQGSSPNRFYLIGEITYSDVFKNRRHTHFCFSLDATNNNAVRPCENKGSNDAD